MTAANHHAAPLPDLNAHRVSKLLTLAYRPSQAAAHSGGEQRKGRGAAAVTPQASMGFGIPMNIPAGAVGRSQPGTGTDDVLLPLCPFKQTVERLAKRVEQFKLESRYREDKATRMKDGWCYTDIASQLTFASCLLPTLPLF